MTKNFGFLPPELGAGGGSARSMGYPNNIAIVPTHSVSLNDQSKSPVSIALTGLL
jgi:hypothetical protein